MEHYDNFLTLLLNFNLIVHDELCNPMHCLTENRY